MAKATLGGYPIMDGSVSWTLRPGTQPSQSEFEMTRADAEALTRGSLSPVTLKIDTPGADGVEIKFLYVIEKRPADNPHTLKVRVVDRRWFWSFVSVDHSFNVRWTKGFKRVVAGADPAVISPVVTNVRYALWSMKNPTTSWTAAPALKEVWKTVQMPEKEATGNAASLTIDPAIRKLTGETLPLEDVVLSDPGDAAFKRILDFIPGAEVTVDPDGSVVVYSQADGGEVDTMDALLPEQEDGGHAEVVDYSRQRPREVRIFFTPEPEIKFSFNEAATPSNYAGIQPDDLKPTLDNVLAIPDHELKGRAQGTWWPIASVLSDWGPIPNFGSLTLPIVRKALVPFMDLWTGAKVAGLSDAKGDWGARIGAVEHHFRRTYKIRWGFMQRIRSLRAYRVATMDQATGTRSPALAYQDWAVVATQRSLSVSIGGGSDEFAYATNFEKKPTGSDAITKETRASPATVSILDHDQGVFRIEFVPDQFRVHQLFIPSKIDNIPSGKITGGGLIAWNAVHRDSPGTLPSLSPSHRVSTIMTVVPGGPNSKDRLFKVTRGPGDAAKHLPTTLSGGLSNANGPPMDVIIGPGWETARIAWVDSKGDKILNALGLGPTVNAKADTSSLADEVVNLKSQSAGGGVAASLDAIADAVNAAIYAGFSDRTGGTRTAPVTHKAKVRGFIEQVLTRVLPDGEASTTATVSEHENPLDLMSVMPHHVRAIILRLPQR